MGYYTDFSGTVEIAGLGERDRKRLENILHNHGRFLTREEIKVEKTANGYAIHVWGSWKNYDGELEKLVQGIVRAYPDSATGRIDAAGEERDDTWALEVADGKVRRLIFEQVISGQELLFDVKEEMKND
jgi:hypothetical protein